MTVVGRFRDVVVRQADAPAVIDRERTWSYAELAGLAGGIRSLIRSSGVAAGERVGLLLPRGAEAVAALLGTLGSGAAYVPLDPAYPHERLDHMARHSGVTAILTDAAGAGFAEASGRALRIEDAGYDKLSDDGVRGLDEPAYVLYTSGSTGLPKGVVQSERNLLHCVDNQITALGITPEDRMSLVASLSFDAAIPDVFPALLSGAALVPLDVAELGPAGLAAALAEHRVTVYHSTPTVYRYLLKALGADGRLADVRAVLLGGESASLSDVLAAQGRFRADCVFVNGYGATEATFVAHEGRPLPGYEIELEGGESADEGEIVVRSPHVALGYWQDEERTAERFGIGADGVRQYRTGDLGRRLADGRVRCLGRLDRQIKVRGFRVEPGEVESRLDALTGVERSVAVARGEELLAYVQGIHSLDAAALRRGLADVLPYYLVPGRVVVVSELPLTPTGKVDVRRLPDPGAAAPGPGIAEPRTEAEEIVHAEWCAALGAPAIGLDVGFFAAGGHSLLLGVLRASLTARFGRDVPMVRMMQYPTIRGHAMLFGAAINVADAAEDPVPVPASSPARSAGDAEFGRETAGEQIAIVGMAGRFPGAASVDAFFWNQCAGVDGIHDYDEAELRALGIGPGLLADPAHVKSGGRVKHVEDFDAGLFGFGDDEAARTDPQHRIFLECAWEALEDAGCDPERFGGMVGVFASASVNRYFLFHLLGNPAVGAADPDDWEGRLVPHQLADHLPGQVAYRLGLTGPALSVQAACSSSLAAVCIAAQSLADYRSDVALAGGVSVTWPRYRCTGSGMVSPDGRCRAFAADAQGSGFSSGAGVVVLKRLADAEADGDIVHALIRGWAMTNDGAERAGFEAPGVAGQAAAVGEALADAGVDPADVGFVEAHGSGTPLGDAIEVEALTRAFRASGDRRVAACALGAVKTQVGHLDAASGVTGLIKAALAVRDGQIPGNLHFGAPNPEIDFAAGPFRVPVKTEDWNGVPRRIAGVNALGMGGTNVHVIVAQAPKRAARDPLDQGSRTWRLALSAHTPSALRAVAERLGAHLAEHPELRLDDIEHTLAVGRRRLACRTIVECTSTAEAIKALSAERLALDATAASASPSDPSWPEGTSGRILRLPTYPFQRRRHWIEPPSAENRARS
jgi:phthiocerol/phenolphthiocerol synthesis type-I polyketide synthase E